MTEFINKDPICGRLGTSHFFCKKCHGSDAPYSPDMAPGDFFLLPRLKTVMNELRSDNNVNVKKKTSCQPLLKMNIKIISNNEITNWTNVSSLME